MALRSRALDGDSGASRQRSSAGDRRKGVSPRRPSEWSNLKKGARREERGLIAAGERRAWDVVERDIAAPRAPLVWGSRLHAAAGHRADMPWTSRSIDPGGKDVKKSRKGPFDGEAGAIASLGSYRG